MLWVGRVCSSAHSKSLSDRLAIVFWKNRLISSVIYWLCLGFFSFCLCLCLCLALCLRFRCRSWMLTYACINYKICSFNPDKFLSIGKTHRMYGLESCDNGIVETWSCCNRYYWIDRLSCAWSAINISDKRTMEWSANIVQYHADACLCVIRYVVNGTSFSCELKRKVHWIDVDFQGSWWGFKMDRCGSWN